MLCAEQLTVLLKVAAAVLKVDQVKCVLGQKLAMLCAEQLRVPANAAVAVLRMD